MFSNDLFRLVSLRQASERAAENGDPSVSSERGDPRLRHRKLIRPQENVKVSLRQDRLEALKKEHVQLSRRIGDLEAVQRAVVDASMNANLVPKAPTRRDSLPSPARGADLSLRPRTRRSQQIESGLNNDQRALFRTTVARFGGATVSGRSAAPRVIHTV